MDAPPPSYGGNYWPTFCISLKRGKLSLSADDSMSIVSNRTVDSEAERNLLDGTAETEDSKKTKGKTFGWANFFWKRASQWAMGH